MSWLKVATITDIPRLGSRVLETVIGSIAIFRTSDDQIFALNDRCPHKQGLLSQGIVHGCKVTCPLHNWMIELHTGCAVAPDVGQVKTFAVKIEHDDIYLKIEDFLT
ncbi:MAG: hypothetical protein RL637_1738 [Pseudomonadota bacterium]|jgi:nitrite reductase (NADH) small subunit